VIPDDDAPEYWDDYDYGFAKEEPDCYACTDAGCRACQPTRFDILRWELRSRVRDLIDKILRRNRDNELPF
jgi:hypothetical protein